MSNKVFPAPLGPSNRKVGVTAVFLDARYRNVWSKMGNESATTKAMSIAHGSPERSRESALSGEDQSILSGG